MEIAQPKKRADDLKLMSVDELLNLREVVDAELGRKIAAEKAGLEVVDVENLRPHYARTCKEWVSRLVRNKDACLRHVDSETFRTWLLYLASSSASFEAGDTEVHQVLFAKRGAGRPFTREYMYTGC